MMLRVVGAETAFTALLALGWLVRQHAAPADDEGRRDPHA